jgi:hypothetical protein
MATAQILPALNADTLSQTAPALLNKAAPALMNSAQANPQLAQLPNNPQLAQLQAQMADIIEPSSIGLWPLAWGWWALMAGIIIVLAAGIYWLRLRKQANAYRHHALAQLKRIRNFDNRHQQAKALMVLTKRVALTACPSEREQINRLSGDAWLLWLNNHTKKPLFNDDVAEQWQANLYRPNNDSADDALTERCKRWIAQHRDTPINHSQSHTQQDDNDEPSQHYDGDNRSHDDPQNADKKQSSDVASVSTLNSTSPSTPAISQAQGANHV